jgi:hypothetical protein
MIQNALCTDCLTLHFAVLKIEDWTVWYSDQASIRISHKDKNMGGSQCC